MNAKLLLVSSLEKVFPDEEPRAFDGRIEGFQNEPVSFQAAWKCADEGFTRDYARIRVESPIADAVRVRLVKNVAVSYPTLADADDYYLRKTPGLYPDRLAEIQAERVRIWGGAWQSAWLDVEADESLPAGVYPIDVILSDASGEELARARAEYRRIAAKLPDQTLIRTQWFHNDGLCHYYGVEVFSEEYWTIVENFLTTAAKRGINCVLTPIHTPPLDTGVGLERMTCQLVDVEKLDSGYAFRFDRLRRWVETAERAGMQWFEMAHLFTQWGAKHAPKIVATVNGEEKRIFGWDTDATGEEYVSFLRCYIPALIEELNALGIADRCIFHVSDEPNQACLDEYMAARNIVSPLLEGFPMIDALSDVQFYHSGAVTHPVPACNHIRPFLDANIPDLWTYYCVGQYKDVTNAFIAMPSARTRILGVQLFKYHIAGFLQWGYNFYNSQYSEYPIDPYATNDGDGFTPAGDCFIVYPGPGGKPEESIRLMTMSEAMYDLRALQMLEWLRGYDFVMSLVEADGVTVEFDRYPKGANYLLSLRRRVNAEIEKALSGDWWNGL